MICVSIKAATTESALAAMERARAAGADLAEVRADFLEDPDIAAILSRKSLPVIVTVRPVREGGAFAGDESVRLRLLRRAVELGAEYVDVEGEAAETFFRELGSRGKTKIVLSCHQQYDSQESLRSIVDKMSPFAPDVVKIAVRCGSIKQLLDLHRFRRGLRTPAVVIPMGEEWEWYRLLYRRWGDAWSYCSLDEETATAEGQATVEAMVGRYRAASVTLVTKVFGLLGNPIAQSRGPALFNRLFRERGLDAVYVPMAIHDLDGLRELMDEVPLSGMSVTIPHKQVVIPFLDRLTAEAREIGAVNTVVREGEAWVGANTDAEGAMGALRPAVEKVFGSGMAGKRALVVGAGGAARAVAWGLRREGASVGVTGRNSDHVRAFAAAMGCSVAKSGEHFDLMINTTPVADRLPVPDLSFSPRQAVMDCIAHVPETVFLRRAREGGAEVVHGMEMFLRQAIAQARLFAGLDVALSEAREGGGVTSKVQEARC